MLKYLELGITLAIFIVGIINREKKLGQVSLILGIGIVIALGLNFFHKDNNSVSINQKSNIQTKIQTQNKHEIDSTNLTFWDRYKNPHLWTYPMWLNWILALNIFFFGLSFVAGYYSKQKDYGSLIAVSFIEYICSFFVLPNISIMFNWSLNSSGFIFIGIIIWIISIFFLCLSLEVGNTDHPIVTFCILLLQFIPLISFIFIVPRFFV